MESVNALRNKIKKSKDENEKWDYLLDYLNDLEIELNKNKSK